MTASAPSQLDSSLALQTETSAIVCAVFVGALGWEVCYNIPHDLGLLFSRSWLRSPVRILSRLAYMFSRYCALASLMINVSYWYYPHGNDLFCQQVPYVVESLMAFSYMCTLVVLMLRTIALYPTANKRDWTVFFVILAILLVNAAFAIWLPFNVRGARMPSSPTRCLFYQERGDTALRCFLISAVVFDIVVLLFTIFKLFSSGTYLFYSRKTLVGRYFFSSRELPRETPMTTLAAELIAQGLYDFAAITFVGCGALTAYLTITVVTYQAMTINCIGAISAALAGGVFRETARAASTMKAVYEFEERMRRTSSEQARPPPRMASFEEDRCDLYASKQPPTNQDMKLDYHCSEQDYAVHHKHGEGHFDFESQTTFEPPSTTVHASTPEAVLSFERYLPESSSHTVDRRTTADTLLPLQMSLRAFDDGAPSKNGVQTETLGVVSVLGGGLHDSDDRSSSPSQPRRQGLSPPPRTVARARTVQQQY